MPYKLGKHLTRWFSANVINIMRKPLINIGILLFLDLIVAFDFLFIRTIDGTEFLSSNRQKH
jgi:hypothetical protein